MNKSDEETRKEPFLDRHPRTALYLSIIGLLLSIMALMVRMLK